MKYSWIFFNFQLFISRHHQLYALWTIYHCNRLAIANFKGSHVCLFINHHLIAIITPNVECEFSTIWEYLNHISFHMYLELTIWNDKHMLFNALLYCSFLLDENIIISFCSWNSTEMQRVWRMQILKYDQWFVLLRAV